MNIENFHQFREFMDLGNLVSYGAKSEKDLRKNVVLCS